MFTLVPHTIHETQPLDTAVYGPLKYNWQSVCHDYIQSHPGRVIAKYQFSKLFSKVWLSTIVPGNIISGFKHCGVYHFNLRAVLDHDPCNDVSITDEVTHDGTSENSQLEEDTDSASVSFTAEEELKYSTRFAEGYNLYDPKYVAWLKVSHPEEDFSRFLSLSEYFPDAVTSDELSVIEPCYLVSISTQCVDVSSVSSCITSTPRTVSSTSATVSTLNINTHVMSPVEASMESSTTFTSVPSSSTQSTPLVGTAVVHTSSTVLNSPNLAVAPNASIQLIYLFQFLPEVQIQGSLSYQLPVQVLSQCPLLRFPSQALPQVLLSFDTQHRYPVCQCHVKVPCSVCTCIHSKG